ncbi:MAG: hypothetical protein CSA65_04285 [Proteobacteria bacterium]|nr:MAG: hypothetical protein CSA65_04285 [Pseudomonadota bacterium]
MARGERAPTKRERRALLGLRLLGYGVLGLLLSAIAGMMVGHRQTLFIMTSGLTWDVLYEGFSSGYVTDMSQVLSTLWWADWVMLVAPVALLGFFALPPRALRWRDLTLGLVALVVLGLNLVYLPTKTSPVVTSVRHAPIWFTFSDMLRALTSREEAPPTFKPSAKLLAKMPLAKGRIRWNPNLPLEAQYLSVAYLHPTLITKSEPLRHPPKTSARKPWNVLLVLMESAGRNYVLDKMPRPHGAEPAYAMPFLRKLADQGLSLENHFSPSNSSPRSIFSLFSGLNPMPEITIYAMRKGIGFPSLVTFLGPSYRSFLVTPASLRWYFPRHYFDLRGPQKIYDYYGVPGRRTAPKVPHARHEEETTTYFIKQVVRSIKAGRPFFATYYSFVAHWPYPDFGRRYHRWPHTRKRWRYLNNLVFLDEQIERMYNAVAKHGALDRTVFVFVGDHGEAFGQHPRNWTHSRHSYNENYRTPMVFWQPKLFSPQKVSQPTSHPDVLPTLLDALAIPHNDLLLQGESLFQDRLRRRYIFLYGNEGTLSSVSREGVKLQIAYKRRGHCWVYDLRTDPKEKKRLSCKEPRFAAQLAATRFYQQYQRSILRAYNQTAAAGKPFYGQSHPRRVTSKATRIQRWRPRRRKTHSTRRASQPTRPAGRPAR